MNNEQHNELKRTEHNLTYQYLWKHKDDTLSLAICLSEFIDNSLSSCEQTYWDKGENFHLVIKIEFKDRKYFITDNAGGMTEQKLNDAMLIGNKNYDNDNSLKNQYGLGMKSAIFWIGKDAIIYSKSANVKEICGRYQAKNKKDEDKVVHVIDEITEQNFISSKSGTKIVVTDVYGNDRVMTDDKVEKVKYFLGYRYSRYLKEKNKLSIIIKSERFDKYQEIHVENMDVYKDGVFQFNIDNSKFTSQQLHEKVSASLDNYRNYYGDKLIEEFKHKLCNGENLEFEDWITFTSDDNSNIKAKARVYVLEKASKELAGVAIAQSNRYICHPTRTKKEENYNGLYKAWNEKFDNGYWRWIRIDLNLEDIPGNEKCLLIKPEKNKKEIIFDSNNTKITNKDFTTGISNFLKKWINLTSIVRELSNHSSNSEKTRKFENKEANVNYDEENNTLNTQEIINFDNLNQKVKVQIKMVDDIDGDWLIKHQYYKVVDDIHEYQYEYNSANKYFSKIKKDSELTYTLKLLIYLDIFLLKNENSPENVDLAKSIDNVLNFFHQNKDM